MNTPNEVPRSFLHGHSKQDLIVIIQTTLEKTKTKHQEARHWRNEAQRLSAELDALRGTRAGS